MRRLFAPYSLGWRGAEGIKITSETLLLPNENQTDFLQVRVVRGLLR